MYVSFKPFLRRSCLFLLICIMACSCEFLGIRSQSKNYMLPRPQKIFLDKKLSEISGLFYLPRENYFLAIADDKKKVYRLSAGGQVSDYFPQDLGASGDYEDVVKVDHTVYVLRSDGHIVAATREQTGDSLQVTDYPFLNNATNDFESMYYDASAGGLVVLCKSCAHEKGKKQRTAYLFHLNSKTWNPQPFYVIPSKAVNDVLKDGRVEFKPSAAAIHPLEKRLYILASAGHLLVITDLRGKVQEVFRLNPGFYPQAEGIAFASNGDMYVTNEAKLGKPTLLRIPYKPSLNKK